MYFPIFHFLKIIKPNNNNRVFCLNTEGLPEQPFSKKNPNPDYPILNVTPSVLQTITAVKARMSQSIRKAVHICVNTVVLLMFQNMNKMFLKSICFLELLEQMT